VGAYLVLQPSEQLLRRLTHGEVEDDGDADSEGGDEREDQVGDGPAGLGDASLGDRGGATYCEQQIFGVGAGRDGSQANRGGQVVLSMVAIHLGISGC
jgi:hypothetical protein